jgi:hypothetical protein
LSDGTETGDGLLQDIKSNTGKTATNTDRLGDYIKELTKAVQGMDRNTSKIAGTITNNSNVTNQTDFNDQGIIDAVGSGT